MAASESITPERLLDAVAAVGARDERRTYEVIVQNRDGQVLGEVGEVRWDDEEYQIILSLTKWSKGRLPEEE